MAIKLYNGKYPVIQQPRFGNQKAGRIYHGYDLAYGAPYEDPQPVLTNLKVWYDANDAASYPGSGTDVTDLSGNGLDATMDNSLPVNTSGGIKYWDWGDSQNTRRLNVTWDSALDFSSAGAVSAEAWVYLNSTTLKDGEGSFFNLNLNGSHNYNGYQYIFRYTSTEKFESFIGNTSSWGQKYDEKTLSSAGVSTGNWYQLVFTYGTADYKNRMYVNGSEVFESSAWTAQSMLSVGGSPSLHIGNGLGTSAQVAARISIARLYDRVLTAEEVTQNYNANKATFGL